MRGHVHRRGKTWTYVVDIGQDDKGKRKQRTKGGFPTKKAAEGAANELIASLQQGVYVEPTKLRLGVYLIEHWLPAIRATVRPSTFESYERHVHKYLVPRLGGIVLTKVTPAPINALYADMQLGTLGEPLKAATVRRVHATLHRALRDAVRWRLVPTNAAAAADPPTEKRAHTDVWEADVLLRFLTLTEKHPLHALWRFLAFTGVRRGEALGLRWRDVNLSENRAAIRQTVIPVRHGIVFSEPKTDRGRRSIGLDPDLAAALKKHRRQQAKDRLAMGEAFNDLDLVFCRPDGKALHPEYVSRTFARLVKLHDLPHIRLHDLRHTYATFALCAGVAPRVVSDQLGHSDMTVTQDIYQAVLPLLQDDAAVRIAAFVKRAAKRPGDDTEGGEATAR